MFEIFAENYRGFPVINLKIDRNIFLVGDNSSGKSSLIHLIDFVLSKELDGNPSMDDKYVFDRYDFFSPYFDYADVTIGFSTVDGGDFVSKMITMKRGNGIDAPNVTRFSVFSQGIIFTIVRRGGSVFARYESDVDISSIDGVRYMHFLSKGFRKIKDISGAGSQINSPSSFFSVITQLKFSDPIIRAKVVKALANQFLPLGILEGPSRGNPERFYEFNRKIKASGAHFASKWHDLRDQLSKNNISYVDKFGKNSELFDKLNVKKISRRLYNSPLVVSIVKDNIEFLIGQVGFGVSQIAPVIVDLVYEKERKADSVVMLQQPELHLHPVAQAAFGEFLFDMSDEKLWFIAETHSDFVIDRYRACYRDNKSKVGIQNSKAKIVFCQNTPKGNSFSEIEIEQDGSLMNPPLEYKEFFVNELMNTMF